MADRKKLIFPLIFLFIGGFLYYFIFSHKDGTVLGERTKKNHTIALVDAGKVEKALMDDKLVVLGTSRSAQTVFLMPQARGLIKKIFVHAGDTVKRGAAIVQLDSDKEELAVNRAQIASKKAEAFLSRIEKLRESNTASKVQLTDAKTNYEMEQLVLKDAQLALKQRLISSPIDGVVGMFSFNEGDYVTQNDKITRIDDQSKILVDLWIPEQFSPFVKLGQTVQATAVVLPDKHYEGKICAIDNALDENSRTLHVRIALENIDSKLPAGTSFEVEISFPGLAYLAVDPFAVQWDSKGAYVWKIEHKMVTRVPVIIVQRTEKTILIRSRLLKENDDVILRSAATLQEGSAVTVKKTFHLAPESLSGALEDKS